MKASTRERKIEWIKTNDIRDVCEMDRALGNLIQHYGFDWFTDEQIDDLASEGVRMMRRWHNGQVRARRSYQAHAALVHGANLSDRKVA